MVVLLGCFTFINHFLSYCYYYFFACSPSVPLEKEADHAQNPHTTPTAPFVWVLCEGKGGPDGLES